MARGKKLNSEADAQVYAPIARPTTRSPFSSLRQLDVLADHVDAVAGRAGEHRRVGLRRPAPAPRAGYFA